MSSVKQLSELEQMYGGRLTPNGMKDIDYKKGNVRFLRFAGAMCPICGDTTWCQINVTGTKVICQREKRTNEVVKGFKYVKDIGKIGGYLYELVDPKAGVKFDPSLIKRTHLCKMSSPDKLDTMNRLVLQAYALTDEHRKDLEKRGLTDEMINLHKQRGFGSYYVMNKEGHAYFTQAKAFADENGEIKIKSRWTHVLKRLGLPTDLWKGVPGFFLSTQSVRGFNYKFPLFSTNNGKEKGPEGMLVPYYDEYNRIRAFQIRKDRINKYAKITKGLKLNNGKLNVRIYGDDYKVYLDSKAENKMIASGKIDGRKEITLSYGVDVMKEEYSFKIQTPGKYFWVSSTDENLGADTVGKWPIQVAYNPTVAKLDPNNAQDHQKLTEYIAKPKSVWVTEGALKGYITAANLSKAFSEKELDEYGRDVLAVAGVNSYQKFLPMLKKLNVQAVTIAYDMDMLQNDQVAQNYSDLINMLNNNGFRVYISTWDPEQAKGIDDALVGGIKVYVDHY